MVFGMPGGVTITSLDAEKTWGMYESQNDAQDRESSLVRLVGFERSCKMVIGGKKQKYLSWGHEVIGDQIFSRWLVDW